MLRDEWSLPLTHAANLKISVERDAKFREIRRVKVRKEKEEKENRGIEGGRKGRKRHLERESNRNPSVIALTTTRRLHQRRSANRLHDDDVQKRQSTFKTVSNDRRLFFSTRNFSVSIVFRSFASSSHKHSSLPYNLLSFIFYLFLFVFSTSHVWFPRCWLLVVNR